MNFNASSSNGQPPADAFTFFRSLYGDDAPGWLTISAIPKTFDYMVTEWFPGHALTAAARYVKARREDADVYVGLGLRKEQRKEGRGESQDVLGIPALWVELDFKHPAHKKLNLPESLDALLALLKEAIPLPPSIIILSGHGVHIYWLFRELWIFTDDEDQAAAAHLLRRLQATVKTTAALHGWDIDTTSDLARVLRVPDTMNWKIPDHPEPVRVLEADPDRRYNPHDFDAYLVDIEATTGGYTTHEAIDGELQPIDLQALNIPAWLKYLIRVGTDPDYAGKHPSRSEAEYKAIQELIKAGIDDLTIMSLMLDPRNAVSEKPRQRGRKWLASELARAHAKLNGHQRRAASAPEPEPSEAHDEECNGPKNGDDQEKQEPSGGGFIANDRGRLISCQHNALIWLARKGYECRVWLDTFRQSIMVDGKPLTDDVVIEMVRRMEASLLMRWAEAHVHSALVSLGSRNARSSLVTWLDSLTWDGKRRLRTLFSEAYGAEVTEYTEACADVLFKSAVARAYQPGCQADVTVVLIGDQGIGKSRGIAELVPDPAWYTDDLGGDLYDRKAGEGLQGKWLIEFGEFARINRATIDVVKAFLSRRVDHYRPAYGRMAKDFPRQCVFIGTTNNRLPLQDLENRRFMPVICTKEMTDIASQRDQLWAEAVHRYKAGEPWWVTDGELLRTIKERQDDARQHDEWEQVLKESLLSVMSTSLMDVARRLNIPVDRLDKGTQTRIGLAMKAIGFTRKRDQRTPGRPYYWARDE
jgi:hypothetical protein